MIFYVNNQIYSSDILKEISDVGTWHRIICDLYSISNRLGWKTYEIITRS